MNSLPLAEQNYLTHAFADCGRVELRVISGGRVLSGIYDRPESLVAALSSTSADAAHYITLNQFSSDWSARDIRPAGRNETIGNADITRIKRIAFDFDPARDVEANSTDDELEQARARAYGLARYLNSAGWPEPVIACSGNGYHLIYRCTMPATAETKAALDRIYSGLDQKFGDDVIKFDKKVRNFGRVLRLYGTANRKGPHSAERPHRMSACRVPPRWGTVSRQQFMRLAGAFRPAQSEVVQRVEHRREVANGSGDYRTLDVASWLRAHGLHRKDLGDGTHYIQCPWQEQHSEPQHRPNWSDCAVFENGSDRWPGFYCHHDHCNGRTIVDVMNCLGDADSFCGQAFEPQRMGGQ